MTLDEAIKHAEEVAEEQNELCKRYDRASGYSRSHNESIRTNDAKKHEKCGQEHIQLAGWLRELKALKTEQCADAISREAALEAILTRVPDFCGDEGGNLIGRNETASYIRNLPSITPKQKWTPISKEMPEEKLPRDFQRVLITVVNYDGDKVVRVASYINPRRTFRVEGSSNIWEVGEKGLLAWMPLPEPYKQKESEAE